MYDVWCQQPINSLEHIWWLAVGSIQIHFADSIQINHIRNTEKNYRNYDQTTCDKNEQTKLRFDDKSRSQ